MEGCRVINTDEQDEKAVLFGQPPEVLKAILKGGIGNLDVLVLPDVRERGNVLLNNLEFPLYYFLFVANGLAQGRLLTLVGDETHISHALKQLRLTLLGPTVADLQDYGTDDAVKREWINSIEFFALKNAAGEVRDVSSFFHIVPFVDDVADTGEMVITRQARDVFELQYQQETALVDLNDCEPVNPPYQVVGDYVPAGLVKLGVEVLGGASGFSPEEASTGLALCHNGNYILVDAIPFLDHHLRARGISKNQISAVFLTHLHDDHCSMFPLMLTPHPVEIITTREIYDMSLQKLAMGLGWSTDVIQEHFRLIEVIPGTPLNYYGLTIDAHYTVHSIPTIGATFKTTHHGREHRVCVVGDNQSFSEIREMGQKGLISSGTEQKLRNLYHERFDLLIADGGMGLIHGDPADALESQADRVVFVHVDSLPERFNATFSLASSGKRYTVLDGDGDIYTTRIIEFLMENFDKPLSTRWLSTLFADKSIQRYNTDDVIIKQGADTRGIVYLIITGYCEVIHHDGEIFRPIATREAGDFIGEMAVVTGLGQRNASVVARTPVTVCEFSEQTFGAFVEAEGVKEHLLSSWALRPVIAKLPCFANLNSTVIDTLCFAAQRLDIAAGESLDMSDDAWYLVHSGQLSEGESLLQYGHEAGAYRPFWQANAVHAQAVSDSVLLRFDAPKMRQIIQETPQLNYNLRKYRIAQEVEGVDWLHERVESDILDYNDHQMPARVVNGD